VEEEVSDMAVTPHDRMTERIKEIVEKARAVSQVIEAIKKATEAEEEEEEHERRA
jgi:hypothetical protein